MSNIIKKPCTNFFIGRSSTQGVFKPEIVVIHIMVGTLTGTDSWFAVPQSQVSAHYGIGLTGEVHQYVEEKDQAWHAGRVLNPTFKLYKPGGVNPNLYTIGIEHEGQDLSKGPMTQINASAALLRDICTRWNIPIDRDHVIGHYQVYDQKPNCPATDKSVIDKLIEIANGPEPVVQIFCPQSKVDRIKKIIEII